MIQLKVHNDGKKKSQSYEVWCDDVICDKGYGASEREAMEEYKNNLDSLLVNVSNAYSDLIQGRHQNVSVDFMGEEIK